MNNTSSHSWRMAENPWLLGPIAHRGLYGENISRLVENTMEAFLACVDAGCPIELDVRLSRDGVVMVHHDGSLLRLCGEDVPLNTLTARELMTYRLMGREDAVIPTFSRVLRAVNGAVPLLIEVKQTALSGIGPLEEAVAAHLRDYSGPYALESFHPLSLRALRKLLPGAALGQLAAWKTPGVNPLVGQAAGRLLFSRWIRPDFIAYEKTGVHERAVRAWRRRGVPILAYTVEAEKEWEAIRPYCDGYIFQGFFPGEKATSE